MPRQYTPRVQLICPACRRDFELPPSMVRKGRQHCSDACRFDASPDWAKAGIKRGVYAIVHCDSGRAYVGSSVDVPGRLWQHLRQLTRAGSPHRLLQEAWTALGADAFEFKILEAVDPFVTLFDREQVWMDRFRAGGGLLNSHPRADTPLGTIRPQAAREAIADGKLGSRNPSAKLTDDDVAAIRQRLASGESAALIARAYGVSSTPIHSIKRGEWGAAGKRKKVRGPSRTLSSEIVDAIRRDALTIANPRIIAERHGVSRSAVSRILRGKTHGHDSSSLASRSPDNPVPDNS